jgi:phosphomannomutase
MDIHIDEVLNLPLVDAEAVAKRKFKVVLDGVNSSGGIIIPKLLELMGVECVKLYCEPNGQFPHNPEPLKEHLGDICKLVLEEKADFGIVVDPDVDRLAFISNDGEMFGEEYTLVACADYVLSKTPGNTISNMSSSRALRDITNKHNGNYKASAVGEVNVVALMKETNAIIGGEGNGGIIYPESHYGRDSLVGVALFLTHLASLDCTVAELRASYPQYYMSKNKIELTPQIDVDAILVTMTEKYKNEDISTIDGVKIDFATEWVHLRKSNTEPIIRIYTEAATQVEANILATRIIDEIKSIAKI